MYFLKPFLYVLLFIYITYEAFREVFSLWIERYVFFRDKEGSLKETNYLKYLVKTRIYSFIYPFKNSQVFFAVIMYILHHYFIDELLDEAKDFKVKTFIDNGIKIGFVIAFLSALTVYLFHQKKRK